MYTIKTSERNNDKATEFETKSMLYLMTKSPNGDSVELFIIDCFNDVTGVGYEVTDTWDIQSKGVASLTPAKIGRALYTLFANYVSDIDFGHHILYIPVPKNEYIVNSDEESFDMSNFKEKNRSRIKEGLTKEIHDRADSDVDTPANALMVDSFLEKVLFVTDRYEKADYIRAIIQFKNIADMTDEFLNRIFDEIRSTQAIKKIRNVYGETVTSVKDAEKYEKNIYRKEIELLVVNRIIGNDMFSAKGVPVYFIKEIQAVDEDDIADIVQDCQTHISRTLFNRNNKRAFWHLLEEIMTAIVQDRKASIRELMSKITPSTRTAVFTLDDLSLLYLIAIVKEGLKQ